MRKNIIFVFSGTGNSLWAARKIADELENCQVIAMNNGHRIAIPKECDRIGFVYPTYASGVPRQVKKFIQQTDFVGSEEAYFFGVATCGKVSRAENAVAQLDHLLKRKEIRLNYGERLRMFPNYVVRYDMSDAIQEDARQAAVDIQPMIENIKSRRKNKIEGRTFRYLMWMGFVQIAPNLDRNFHVSDTCVKCGICQKVCPVNNIAMDGNNKPYFTHHCEHCLACIQNCPAKAINYKNVTQERKRYIHPDISWKDLAELSSHSD